MNEKKIIYSILLEIKNGIQEPKATDYGLSNSQFADIVKIIKDSEYANNIAIAGRDEKLIVWLNKAKITLKGIDFLEQNSAFVKTYKGLKEIRDWIKL